ncbi:hypothetical protein RRG08_010610 [Elysia crispata]|uniref:Uncharacterized protein n=1 Tax=Elysia crispata TaxID=231223 RepID=A0AAE1AMS5_9GAST|nr:hypothetical protein RRG08_010610 [Elysia crispata]
MQIHRYRFIYRPQGVQHLVDMPVDILAISDCSALKSIVAKVNAGIKTILVDTWADILAIPDSSALSSVITRILAHQTEMSNKTIQMQIHRSRFCHRPQDVMQVNKHDP